MPATLQQNCAPCERANSWGVEREPSTPLLMQRLGSTAAHVCAAAAALL
jgi:hypothetical protein